MAPHSFFVRIDPAQLDPGAIGRLGFVQSIEEIRPDWKLHPSLAVSAPPPHALFQGQGGVTRIAVYVLIHQEQDLIEVALRLQRELSVDVLEPLLSINGLVVEMPLSQLSALVARDEVFCVEPPLPRMSEVNDSNRILTQVDAVQGAPYNLDGSGVTVMVYDGGSARATHQDFGGRLTVRDSSGLSNHATHVAGTVGGDGTASGGTFRGMAPGVSIESYGFEYDGTSIFLYTNPGDIEADYTEAINLFGADLATNSIGTNTEPNGFVCNLQGDYGVTASVIDAIVGGSVSGGNPFRVVWANGNERQGSNCDIEGFGDYYSTGAAGYG